MRAELTTLVEDFTPIITELWPRLEDHKYRCELHSYGLAEGYDKLVVSVIIALLIEALKCIGVADNKLGVDDARPKVAVYQRFSTSPKPRKLLLDNDSGGKTREKPKRPYQKRRRNLSAGKTSCRAVSRDGLLKKIEPLFETVSVLAVQLTDDLDPVSPRRIMPRG